MRRRALLRTGGASLVIGMAGAGILAGSPRIRATTTQADYEPLGRVEIDNAAEAVVGDDGDIVYVAATTGFATVDISDPADPEVLAEERGLEFDDQRFNEILDVKVDGNLLAVAGPANQANDFLFHGFAIYDVSDPAEPELLGEPYETGYHIHNCFLEDETLYVVGNGELENPLVVFDLGGDEIEEISRWSLVEQEPDWQDVNWLVRYLHDVYVHDDIAYLAHWNAGTYLLDVSDPSEPEYISHVSETTLEDELAVEDDNEAQMGLPGNDHYSAVDDTGDLLGVGREAWATGQGDTDTDRPGGIDLYDVSDPADPVHRATIDAPRALNERYNGGLWTTAHNFELRDNELYASWYQGGVTIHNVSDPSDPEEIASWHDPEAAGFWTARVAEPGETFVASSTELIPNAPTEGALYTFPIEAGEQADQPSLTDPDDLEFDVEAPDGDDNGGSDDADDQSNETPTDANGGDNSSTEADDSSDSVPGFTIGVGAAGGLAALEALRRRNDRGE
ncbi:hypothetical protein G6M89_01140 [Natronolimnobius sp. AArcel1]|uniref:LVIVD repeat-containing protein n=1 Tax=Natronolimnobius sp. AArcel1 TaxID=1679093 RepID=UPI0013EB2FEA|nr:hypothetical protein [Natronolimnobius sp. AArcel1]NGM67624.1 hypothetical protein [Natronolimnobius sp. AArcel1]